MAGTARRVPPDVGSAWKVPGRSQWGAVSQIVGHGDVGSLSSEALRASPEPGSLYGKSKGSAPLPTHSSASASASAPGRSRFSLFSCFAWLDVWRKNVWRRIRAKPGDGPPSSPASSSSSAASSFSSPRKRKWPWRLTLVTSLAALLLAGIYWLVFGRSKDGGSFRGHTINVGGDYGWGSDVLRFDYHPITAHVGDRLNFTAAKEPVQRQDVYEMGTQAAFEECDFKNATLLGSGVVMVVLDRPGEHYYACSTSKGLHCHDGQKIRVTVNR